MNILFLVFKKIESEDKTKYEHFYSISQEEVIINESDIDNVFQSIHTTVLADIQKSLGKGSGWIIDSLIDHTRITKVDKDFAKRLDFKYIKFSVKIRDIHKSILSALAFLVLKIKKNIQSMYQNNVVKKNMLT